MASGWHQQPITTAFPSTSRAFRLIAAMAAIFCQCVLDSPQNAVDDAFELARLRERRGVASG